MVRGISSILSSLQALQLQRRTFSLALSHHFPSFGVESRWAASQKLCVQAGAEPPELPCNSVQMHRVWVHIDVRCLHRCSLYKGCCQYLEFLNASCGHLTLSSGCPGCGGINCYDVFLQTPLNISFFNTLPLLANYC